MAKKTQVGKAEWKDVVRAARAEVKNLERDLALMNDILTSDGMPSAKVAAKLNKRAAAAYNYDVEDALFMYAEAINSDDTNVANS